MNAIAPINVSVPAAAKMLRCSRATLYNLLRGGKVRAVKLGQRTLVPVDSLHRYSQTLPDMRPTPAS